MTARSQSSGHPTVWINGEWLYEDTLTEDDESRPCAKCGKKGVKVAIKKPDQCCSIGPYDCTTYMNSKHEVIEVDYCISHIVAALNAANITTIASCCGHGKQDGNILLEDGNELVLREFDPENHITYGYCPEGYVFGRDYSSCPREHGQPPCNLVKLKKSKRHTSGNILFKECKKAFNLIIEEGS